MKGLAILSHKATPISVTEKLLSTLKVNVTSAGLEQELLAHPDYPSLLAISDVIQGYGVENLALITIPENLIKLPVPFIAQIKDQNTLDDVFAVVTFVKEGKVGFFDPVNKKSRELATNGVAEIWPSGIALIVDASNATGEIGYINKRRKEKQVNLIGNFSKLALPIIIIFTALWRFFFSETERISSLMYLVLSAAGSVTGVLLLWYEIDEYNPLLQKICSAGKKVNCGAILHSAGAKIAGMSWTSIGFTYFTGSLLLFLFSTVPEAEILEISAWLSSLASFYIAFSIYYQWKIAKQWCILCLTIQAILALQVLIAALSGWHTSLPFSKVLIPQTIISIIFCYLLPFSIIQILIPLFKSQKENKYNKAEVARLKHNPALFEALLKKQVSHNNDTDGLGITVGNPDAKYRIVKVCNPYCGPCSIAHIALGQLVQANANVQLQIIFLTGTNRQDPTRTIARHLLAIAEKKDEQLMEQALDDWYLPDRKDYDKFASMYPVSEVADDYDDKIDAMIKWVRAIDVKYTPSVFINGHMLPNNYSVNDLKYYLSV